MVHLSVNVDYVAVIRQARKTTEPDPVYAAGIVEMAGAHGITAHLREDRRHIIDRDIRILRETVHLPFNLEMAATEEMVEIALKTKPELVTLVPEKRLEVTTEGGLDVNKNIEKLSNAVKTLKSAGISVSMFIDPVRKQIDASKEVGADCIEIHTGEYANSTGSSEVQKHLEEINKGAVYGIDLGLEVHAGHGLTYKNISPLLNIKEISGYYIGHSIMSRAIYVGLDRAVRDMLNLINK